MLNYKKISLYIFFVLSLFLGFILQENSSLPLSTIAKRVDLSTTPCFNRIKKLEEDGVIKKRVAILDNNKVNLPIILKMSSSKSSKKL